jgi:hypothetical protein
MANYGYRFRYDEDDPKNWHLIRMSPRSYAEDFELENGNYLNRCCACRHLFFGYKRRVICRECLHQKPTFNLTPMHIRFIIYLIGAAIFLISGFAYGFREILPFLAWALPLIGAGELGVYLTRRKHRNDK